MDSSQSSGIGFDIVMAIVLIVTALIGACAPVYLVNQDKMRGGSGRSTLFIVGNMFSGGVMVSAGLCHLLGEALRDMPQTRFPWATFLCGCGFLVTLCADKAASVLSHNSSSLHDSHHQGVVDDGEMIELTMGRDLAEAYRSSAVLHTDNYHRAQQQLEQDDDDVIERGHSGMVHARGDVVYMTSSPVVLTATLDTNDDELHNSNHDDDHIYNDNDDERKKLLGGDGDLGLRNVSHRHHHSNSNSNTRAIARTGSTGGSMRSEGCHAHDIILAGNSSAKVSFITAVLMGAALCFHSLLEGAALGAQETIANSMHIFIAIVSHKGLAAYALGSSVIETKVEYVLYIYNSDVCFFSIRMYSLKIDTLNKYYYWYAE
jgi:zinc transporter 1/2/3